MFIFCVFYSGNESGPETEVPNTSTWNDEAGSVSREEFDTRRRVVSSSGESISSHDEPATNEDEDEATSLVTSLLGKPIPLYYMLLLLNISTTCIVFPYFHP